MSSLKIRQVVVALPLHPIHIQSYLALKLEVSHRRQSVLYELKAYVDYDLYDFRF